MASVLPKEYYSVDVECVATGRRHDDRAVAFVALVDKNEKLLYKTKVRVDVPILSYLTPLTGLRKGDLDDGKSLDTVIKDIKGFLGRDAVLVGQGIQSDIKWLKLREGVDFKSSINLAELFKVYNPKYDNYSYFTMQHEANILLGPGTIGQQHDPENDARVGIRLFNRYRRYKANPALKDEDQRKLIRRRPDPSYVKRHGYVIEGICFAAYMPKKCICGAPTLIRQN